MIDLLLVIILGIVTWCVASEGAWGAGITLVCVLLAGLLAMNWFEPLAALLHGLSPGSFGWGIRVDVIALLGSFAAVVFLLRLATDRLAPTFMPTPTLMYEICRWSFGLLTAWVTMAIVLTALHTAPFPRYVTAAGVDELIPGFQAERKNFLNVAAPDRQWLGFVQWVSRKSLPRGRVFDGPYFRAGEFEDYWPSFPIRYATRREQIAGGAVVAAPPGEPAGGGLQPVEPANTRPQF